MENNKIALEIQNANYWENVKFAEEITRAYGASHPKSISLSRKINEINKKVKEYVK